MKLFATVATQTLEKVSGETGGMNPRQNRLIRRRFTDDNGKMLLAAVFGAIDVDFGLFGQRQRHPGGNHGNQGDVRRIAAGQQVFCTNRQ